MRYVPLYTRDKKPVIAGDYPGLELGPSTTYGGYGIKWANVSNAPFRYYKKYSHEGGISTPLIVHWPEGFQAKNELRHQPAHIMDIMATCLEVADTPYPESYRDKKLHPIDGKSLLDVFEKDATIHEELFWEHHDHKAVRQGKWKLVARPDSSWELYDMEKDRTETVNLADQYPEKVEGLMVSYQKWAGNNGVIPVAELGVLEIPPSTNPLTREPEEMDAFLKVINEVLEEKGLPVHPISQ